jgi:NADH:quinone reductase (non-electrogenic)
MTTMLPMTQNVNWPRVVIVGAGFAGLHAAKELAHAPVRVTVLDRKNHHTFQPLLYQVALAALSPAEIASPIRNVLRKGRNTEVLLGEVTGFDLNRRVVRADGLELSYDFLIVAAGATHAYFGHPEWEQYAPGLKTIEDATEIRGRVLLAFERAEREAFARRTTPPLNFVVIGAGPTGVELAGAISDISRRYLEHDFRSIDPTKARIILLEGGPRVLPAYPPDLSASAEKQLRDMGVEVRTNAMVTNVEPGLVTVGKEKIPASVILWGAGVSASPLGKMLGAAIDRAGRVLVEPDLSVPGHPEVFVVGDLAAARRLDHPASVAQTETTISDKDKATSFVPGVAPAAIQMGKFAARQIKRSLAGKSREPFRYWDKGSLATIGRSRAVADFGKLHISGYFAWLSWLFIHLMFLIGFRNRIMVMMEWAWDYLTYNHSARLITEPREAVEEERPKARVG